MLLIFCWNGNPPTAGHRCNESDDGNAEASSLTFDHVGEGYVVGASLADRLGKLERLDENSHDSDVLTLK